MLLGRPYYLTFELLDKDEGRATTELRVVPASELHAESFAEDHATPAESRDEPAEGGGEFDIVGEDGELIMRSNRLTVDDPSRQKLSMDEIEELKKAGTGSGKEIIAKIMASHMAIDEKTPFSLAKYTLRKSKKYLRRFTALPMDVSLLSQYILEKEAHRVMELREEMLGLIGSWANVHCAASSRVVSSPDGRGMIGGGRWLVVDDTGGMVVAALAERMGILYPEETLDDGDEDLEQEQGQHQVPEDPTKERKLSSGQDGPGQSAAADTGTDVMMVDAPSPEPPQLLSETLQSDRSNPPNRRSDNTAPSSPPKLPSPELPGRASDGSAKETTDHTHQKSRQPRPIKPQMSALTNTLTVIHSNAQPNLGLLKYFSFDATSPVPTHPLYTNLKTLSWLQLLHPSEDASSIEPEVVPDSVLATWKSGKRGTYYRKRRRWERTSRVVKETRAGGFDGLVVASYMEPAAILRACVPLLRGAAMVVVYSPTVEPLVELSDFHSKERRVAYLARQNNGIENGKNGKRNVEEGAENNEEDGGEADSDFPVNPTLLLAPMLQTARARRWQVLPGRTHPMMTSRGGAEGYLFTATRVLPVEGKVEARGRFRAGKKRKVASDATAST